MSVSFYCALRAIDVATAFIEREAQRLRAIISAPDTSNKVRMGALRELASLSSQVTRGLAGN